MKIELNLNCWINNTTKSESLKDQPADRKLEWTKVEYFFCYKTGIFIRITFSIFTFTWWNVGKFLFSAIIDFDRFFYSPLPYQSLEKKIWKMFKIVNPWTGCLVPSFITSWVVVKILQKQRLYLRLHCHSFHKENLAPTLNTTRNQKLMFEMFAPRLVRKVNNLFGNMCVDKCSVVRISLQYQSVASMFYCDQFDIL